MGLEKGYCWGPNCKEEIEIELCCGAYDCGCQGLPVEPPFCSAECYDAYMLEKKESTHLDLGGF